MAWAGPPPSAESIYAAWLARARSAPAQPFEELLAAHPAEAREVREIRAQWERVERILRSAGVERSGESLASRLESAFGPGVDPRVTLRLDEGTPPTSHAVGAPASDPTSAVLARLALHSAPSARYRLEAEIARGGMGAVLRVRDEDLRRHLAMKVMLGAGAGSSGETPAGSPRPIDPKRRSRVHEEAQVTGQLDHPGIVPVHELGLGADGRVIFKM
jgi:hypothetical protein